MADLPPDQLQRLLLQRLLRDAWTSIYLRPRPIARLAGDAVASGPVGEAMRLGRAWGRWDLAA